MATVNRLSSPSAFRSVFSTGRSYAQGSVVLYVAKRPTGSGPARAGLVVSRKVGGAVARNRAKRLLLTGDSLTGRERRVLQLRFGLEDGLAAPEEYVPVLREQVRAAVAESASQAHMAWAEQTGHRNAQDFFDAAHRGRRWRAARLAGLGAVPAVVKDAVTERLSGDRPSAFACSRCCRPAGRP
jgi:hypothetical protein